MENQPVIAVVARMDWNTSLTLLPAMGRTEQDTLVIQDVESPRELGPGFSRQVVKMVVEHGALELFVIGSSSTESAQDVLDRVTSLRGCRNLPARTPIHGLLFNPVSYELELVHRGY